MNLAVALFASCTAGAAFTAAPAKAEVNGLAAEVAYAGGAPDLVAGVLQINLRLPANLGPGDWPVVVRVGEASSQARVTVSVR